MPTMLYDGMSLLSERTACDLLGELTGATEPLPQETIRKYTTKGVRTEARVRFLAVHRRPFGKERWYYERDLREFALVVKDEIPGRVRSAKP